MPYATRSQYPIASIHFNAFPFLPIYLSHRMISKNGKALISVSAHLWWVNKIIIFNTLIRVDDCICNRKKTYSYTYYSAYVVPATTTFFITGSNCTHEKKTVRQNSNRYYILQYTTARISFPSRAFSCTSLRKKIIKTSNSFCLSLLFAESSWRQVARSTTRNMHAFLTQHIREWVHSKLNKVIDCWNDIQLVVMRRS